MTREELKTEFERLLRRVPELMTPMKVSRCSPLEKNRVYELIKLGKLYSEGQWIRNKCDKHIKLMSRYYNL